MVVLLSPDPFSLPFLAIVPGPLGPILGGSGPGINDSQQILQDASGSSAAVRQAWDYTWEQALQGPLWDAVVNVGVFIAAACLALWCLNFARQWLEDQTSPRALQELIWPLIVIILLSNHGANLSLLCMGMRNVINGMNETLLTSVARGIDLEKTVSEIGQYDAASIQLAKLRSQCNQIVDKTKQEQCITLQTQAMGEILQQFNQQHPDSQYGKSLQDQIASAKQSIGDAINGAAIKTVNSIVFDPLVGLVKLVLVAFQSAFQQLVEVSLLLTAMMGPVAVGATLLPFGAKPLYAWFTAFWSVGLLKLAYNIITGLTAMAIYKTGQTDTLASAVFFGLLAPLLAFAMAAGGGMAVFGGITSVAAGSIGLTVSQFSLGGSTPPAPAAPPPTAE